MSKKQSRRSISVRGTTYVRLRDYCAGAELSMSDFIEKRIAEFFVDKPAVAAPRSAAVKPAQKAPLAPRPVAARLAVARSEALPIRPLPSKSQVVNKPMPTAALRVSAPQPVPQRPVVAPLAPAARPSTGRPAPTPAARVIKVREAVSDERGVDYRAIRF